MKNYDVLDANIISTVDELHRAFDMGYEQGLRDGKEGSYSKLDVEEAYTRGYCAGKNSVKSECMCKSNHKTRGSSFIRGIREILRG